MVLGFSFFVSDIIIEVGFSQFLAHVTWSKEQLLNVSLSLKFSPKTRLELECFELLTVFLSFLVQKLWPKMNKMIKYLFSG